MSQRFDIARTEASHWWRTHFLSGVILHRSMLLFVFVPILLVLRNEIAWSIVVFSGMIPYGLLLEHLARRHVLKVIGEHPETVDEFRRMGVIRTPEEAP